jgi:CheY-like chemotaxis protein
VALVFEEPEGLPALYTDEAKVSQILRNFISNALKFTERGEIRVSARAGAGSTVVFTVADTGIGIAPEDQTRIFEEFTQLDNPVQHRVRGTGLGLPLTRKLAELLGGRVTVESTLGVGSTFAAEIPCAYAERVASDEAVPEEGWAPEPGRLPVLVVEDDALDALLYEKYLRDTPYQPVVARGLREARQVLASVRPCAIVLDVLLRGEDTWAFLAALKASPETAAVPILVVTTVEDEQKGLALGAAAYRLKPVDRAWLLDALGRFTGVAGKRRALVVDDDEIWRYLLGGALTALGFQIFEANDGTEAVGLARDRRPEVILLDLAMPGTGGEDTLEALSADPATRLVPVIIVTSRSVDDAQRDRLLQRATAILSKQTLSREGAAPAIRQALTLAGMEIAHDAV